MTRKVRVAGPGDIPPREGRCAVVEGRRGAPFHTEAGFRAIGADCPHRGGPLSDGMITGDCVTCPLHGWKVSLADGRVLPPNAGRVRVYEVKDTAEGVYLFIRNGVPQEKGEAPGERDSNAAREGEDRNGEGPTSCR